MTASLRGTVCRVFLATLLLAGFVRPASAGWVNFNFNSVALTTGYGTNATVQTYMTQQLNLQAPGWGTVAVTGATATNVYTGDGHVTGPGGQPLTLGTTDGAVTPASVPKAADTFIATLGTDTEIKMVLSKNIYSITFDYEIFPNGNCPTGCTGSNLPDFTFMANGISYVHTYGVAPGSDSADPWKTSAVSNNELAPQLGPKNVTFTFAGGVNTLRFIDWPVTIGVDNVTVSTTPVPEPASMLLLGSGLAAAYAKRRRDQRKASSPVA
jgi:hypothetical protein